LERGGYCPDVEFLEARGAEFDRDFLSVLLEDAFKEYGFDSEHFQFLCLSSWKKALKNVYSTTSSFLERKGARLDPERLASCIEEALATNANFTHVKYLVERRLECLEQEKRYREAWTLAVDAYHRSHVTHFLLRQKQRRSCESLP
jgi:hypothetical protein